MGDTKLEINGEKRSAIPKWSKRQKEKTTANNGAASI